MRSAAPGSGSDYSIKDVIADPKVLIDTVAPTLLFAVAASQTSVGLAAGLALSWCAVVFAYRLTRRQGLVYAVSGLSGVLIGVVVALASGQAEDFFLPGIIGNIAFGALCVGSVLVRRPAVAFTSALLYRWPFGWYFHPRVRPAYSEITWLWAVYYLAKGGTQLLLVNAGDLTLLTTVRLVLGWPGLVVLLAITYAYVRWRLERLGGPDVDTYRATQATAQAE
ncbi:MAG: DUF3159 domain-containing protein [Euzebya sp.]